MTLAENEIRPQALFDEYLSLATADALDLSAQGDFVDSPCFNCGAEGHTTFMKHGFRYQECPDCQNIFCHPRPSAEALS